MESAIYFFLEGTGAGATMAPAPVPAQGEESLFDFHAAIGPAGTSQPAQLLLTGLEGAVAPASDPAPARPSSRAGRAGAARRGPRHRYWSIRDLSRRLWLGRGYELLREMIRGGVLPATRSARSWWIDDADVRGLRAAFDAGAGKVRAFGALDAWLRERCWVAPLTPEAQALVRADGSGFAWRGHLYLPKTAWQAEAASDGGLTYRHRRGMILAAARPLAA
jgi:hypothetical protein